MKPKIFLLIFFILLLLSPCLVQENDPIFMISIDLRFGFMDKSGNVVIKPLFWEEIDLSEGMASVKNMKNQWGYIDKTGKLVIDYQFASADDFSEGIARVQIKG